MKSRLPRWGFDPNVTLVAAASFLMALGEELWKRFLPKYLEALGAPVIAIGLYGSLRDAFDGLYQYPGGWVADRLGRRAALRLFVALALVGYVALAVAPAWPVALGGIVLAMAWTSMASPSLFAVVADALPVNRRAVGFAMLSTLRRIPIAIAPVLGGILIATHGARDGVRLGLVITVGLAALTFAVVSRIRLELPASLGPTDLRGVWRALPAALRRLLASDVIIRTSEGMVDVFVVLYAIDVVGITAPQYGGLVAVQMVTAIVSYYPAGRLADRIGRKPLVIATFLAFAAFPVAVAAADSYLGLLAAFFVAGLRELGEPARKALIVDLARADLRARSVGLYYLIRGIAITPAALVGSLLWQIGPRVPFMAAGGIGLIGTAVFAATVSERDAA